MESPQTFGMPLLLDDVDDEELDELLDPPPAPPDELPPLPDDPPVPLDELSPPLDELVHSLVFPGSVERERHEATNVAELEAIKIAVKEVDPRRG